MSPFFPISVFFCFSLLYLILPYNCVLSTPCAPSLVFTFTLSRRSNKTPKYQKNLVKSQSTKLRIIRIEYKFSSLWFHKIFLCVFCLSDVTQVNVIQVKVHTLLTGHNCRGEWGRGEKKTPKTEMRKKGNVGNIVTFTLRYLFLISVFFVFFSPLPHSPLQLCPVNTVCTYHLFHIYLCHVVQTKHTQKKISWNHNELNSEL